MYFLVAVSSKRKIVVVEKAVGLLNMVFWRSLKRERGIGLQKGKDDGEEKILYRPNFCYARKTLGEIRCSSLFSDSHDV